MLMILHDMVTNLSYQEDLSIYGQSINPGEMSHEGTYSLPITIHSLNFFNKKRIK